MSSYPPKITRKSLTSTYNIIVDVNHSAISWVKSYSNCSGLIVFTHEWVSKLAPSSLKGHHPTPFPLEAFCEALHVVFGMLEPGFHSMSVHAANLGLRLSVNHLPTNDAIWRHETFSFMMSHPAMSFGDSSASAERAGQVGGCTCQHGCVCMGSALNNIGWSQVGHFSGFKHKWA